MDYIFSKEIWIYNQISIFDLYDRLGFFGFDQLDLYFVLLILLLKIAQVHTHRDVKQNCSRFYVNVIIHFSYLRVHTDKYVLNIIIEQTTTVVVIVLRFLASFTIFPVSDRRIQLSHGITRLILIYKQWSINIQTLLDITY